MGIAILNPSPARTSPPPLVPLFTLSLLDAPDPFDAALDGRLKLPVKEGECLSRGLVMISPNVAGPGEEGLDEVRV